ncbi:MAG: SDR family oxidoreductase [FCB group bacterium]|jgi:NAD(P)-dependent dehydrogenase (short-subunit alcohol dehydrogenase family)|nr:SDR family oxidoreductase [FCB group bacterium]
MTGTPELKGQVALVTGAAKRIGHAIALGLAEAGADVAVHYRRAGDEAAALCDSIRAKGRRAWAIQADLSEAAEAEALFSQVVDACDHVDILVNNASIFPENTILDVTPEDLHASMAVHAIAPLLLARRMAALGRSGCIVNLLDARVVDYDRIHAAYHLSKRALMSLTSMLALELAPSIRVNAVAPGLILPPEGKPADYLASLAHTNPLQAYGGPEDIASAVLFLVTSRFVTGQVIYVDGGRHLKGRVYG